jgi:hypothetical protein
MSIPPNPNYIDYDFSDPLCYPGSGPTVFDLSVNGYDASIVAGATFVSDGQKSYFQFNGGSDAISTGTNSTAGLSDFTLNVWCYPENSSGENIVCSIGNDGSGTIPFIDYSLFTSGKFLISNGFGAGTVESSISTPINNWYMVTYTKIGSDLKIYIDGVLAGSTTGTIAISASTEFRLAAYATGVAPHFEGRIAIASIYGSGLTGSQVTDVYNSTVARFYPLQAPIVELDFSDPACFNGTGLTVNDLSASNNDFALADTDYEFTTTFGGELFIDTINLDTTLNHSGLTGYSYGTAAFSFNLWVQINAYNALDLTQIWSLNYTGGSGSHDNPFCGAIGASKYFFFTDGTDTLTTSFVMEPDTWYLVSISKPAGGSSNDVDIYINGQGVPFTGGSSSVINVDNTTPVNSLSAYAANQPVWNSAQTIGAYNFYNVELSAADVLQYYTETKSRFSLFLKYDFQDPACYSGSGTVINDLAGTNTQLSVYTGNWVSGTLNYWDLQGTTILENTNPPATLLNNVFTVNCWYYPDFTNPGFYASVWGIGLNNANQMPILSTQQTGSFNIQWSYGYNLVSYTPTLDWHLVTFVSDGTNTILYVDGVLEGSVIGVGTIGNIAGVTRLRIGCSNSSGGDAVEPAYGKVGYWDYHTVALTAGEVSDLYDATKTPYISPPPPPTPSNVGGRQFAQGFNG